MTTIRVSTMAGLFFAAAALSARAAEWKIVTDLGTPNGSDLVVEGKGPIERDDLERLRKLAGDRHIGIVSLHSPGGDFPEGLKLARYFNEYGIETVLRDGAQCRSACAVAFLGGSSEVTYDEVSFPPARSISPDSTLGFHAPFIRVEEATWNRDAVERAYDRAVRTMISVVKAADSLNIEPIAVAEMMTPQREEMAYATTVKDIGTLRVYLRNVAFPAHATPSMLVNLCANAWSWNDGLDAVEWHAEIVESIRTRSWRANDATFMLTAEDGTSIRRTVVPAWHYGEFFWWCVVDEDPAVGVTSVACRGVVAADTLGEALDLVRRNDDEIDPTYDCTLPMISDPLDWETGRDRLAYPWALVPPETKISEVTQILADYGRQEEPVTPAPR